MPKTHHNKRIQREWGELNPDLEAISLKKWVLLLQDLLCSHCVCLLFTQPKSGIRNTLGFSAGRAGGVHCQENPGTHRAFRVGGRRNKERSSKDKNLASLLSTFIECSETQTSTCGLVIVGHLPFSVLWGLSVTACSHISCFPQPQQPGTSHAPQQSSLGEWRACPYLTFSKHKIPLVWAKGWNILCPNRLLGSQALLWICLLTL